jgi:hypothetical protein
MSSASSGLQQLRAWSRARWEHHRRAWFAPADPRALAICRMLVFWRAWPGLYVRDYSMYADFKSSAWYPVSFFRDGLVPLLDSSGLQLLSLASTVATGLALIGFAYPIAAPVAALTTLYLNGVPQNFGKVDHGDNLFVFALLVFAFARAADAWSVDALLSRLFRKSPRPAPSARYRWPQRFIAVLIVTMYAAAGTSKLMKSGWQWALSDSFRNLLLRHHFTHHPPTQIGVWIARSPGLCRALALGALLTELASPLALFGRWFGALLLGALFLLQVSIWLVIGVRFSPMLPLFACLLPWHEAVLALDRARAWLSTLLAARRQEPARLSE